MNKTVDMIQEQFFHEANSSPMLLSDLASMETYIAESYQERSLIELLQNGDDAQAKRFLIHSYQDYAIVANDGRYFSESDLLAICRSGASTKKRDGGTIGYRGIGFKSIVNLASRVHIISQDLELTFCRDLTNRLLKHDIKVPLIRIPHQYTPLFDHTALLADLFSKNYTTIFIFEKLNSRNLNLEMENFDSSTLLFLRNVQEIKLGGNIHKQVNIERKKEHQHERVTIKDDKEREKWLVIHPKREDLTIEAIAFLLDDKKIVPLDPERSVVHSFMSTKDPVGFPFKINGDFSTDPSRTKVTMDELSKNSLSQCANLLVDVVKDYMANPHSNSYSGLFSVLQIEDSIYNRFIKKDRLKDLFSKLVKEKFACTNWFIDKSGNTYNSLYLRINPDWLNKEDFIRISEYLSIIPIDKSYETIYPGLFNFSKEIGIQTLSIEDALHAIVEVVPSSNGATEILLECLKRFRFNLGGTQKALIIKAKLIEFEDGFLPLNKVVNKVKVNNKYLNDIKTKVNDFRDLNWFIKQLGIKDVLFPESETKKLDNKENKFSSPENGDKAPLMKKIQFKASNAKWRSVETNLAQFYEADDAVTKVNDVSKSNLGYDLEVYYKNDVHYVEVKSVGQLGDSISLTNNEYSTANEKGDKYVLAIVKQSIDSLLVCLIRNPIEKLNLTKRVTRWEWVCDEYSGQVKEFDFL